ncbi:MAG TPA: tetratricopeptide repeat protein [Galbitalea sp.]
MSTADWNDRVDAVWAIVADLSDDELLDRIDALVAERPESDARAAYEAGSARDSIGREADAAPHYQRALYLGLAEPYLGQLLIQYASTLRNLKRYDEGLALLDLLGHEHPLTDAAIASRRGACRSDPPFGRLRERAPRSLSWSTRESARPSTTETSRRPHRGSRRPL